MKQYSFSILLFLMPMLAFSQAQTHSPYSQYGVGDPVREGFVNTFSMGGVNRYMADPFIMNPYNSATYSNLRSVTFDAGLSYSRTVRSGEGISQETDYAGLRYFGMGLPVSDRLGIGFGIVPYSELGYDFASTSPVGETSARTEYSGLGGISKVYVGAGYEVIKDSLNRLSLGANFLYLFGPMERTSFMTFTGSQDQHFNTLVADEMRVTDIGFDAGIHYRRDITKLFTKKSPTQIYWNIGASVMPEANLTTRRTRRALSISNQPKDIVRDIQDTVSTTLPLEFGVGTSFEIVNRNKKNRLFIGFNYEQTQWSNLVYPGESFELNNAEVYSAGLQFAPDEQAIRSLFKLLTYRAGARYAQTRLNIDGNQLTDYGFSGGISIPLIASKSVTTMSTTLNLGMEYGVRGRNAQLTESYTRYLLGISITPNFWDKWFEQRKIN